MHGETAKARVVMAACGRWARARAACGDGDAPLSASEESSGARRSRSSAGTWACSVIPGRQRSLASVRRSSRIPSRPRLRAFPEQEVKDREGGHRIDPPRSKRKLRQQAGDDDHSQPQAIDSIASALSAGLPIFSAIASFRLASRYIAGIVATVIARPSALNAWPSRVHNPRRPSAR
jgi:hypothetical protein